jgi:type I restriction enzyme M protein
VPDRVQIDTTLNRQNRVQNHPFIGRHRLLNRTAVGRGSSSSLYKPDYIIVVNAFPTLVIDAKAPHEDLKKWVSQCGSYCLELNKQYEHNPVEFYLLTNGLETRLYKWDRGKPLVEMFFDDFTAGSLSFATLKEFIAKASLAALFRQKREELDDADFELEPVSLEEMSGIFHRLHDYMRTKEKKVPSEAFVELMKIVFVKIKMDRELRERIGRTTTPKNRDVIFSLVWIQKQTQAENPINDPLFKNLMTSLETEIHDKHKRRIFDRTEEINLNPSTILKVVTDLEHIDFYRMDEDIHGRMFESFLDATVRGQELGQFFTPRDVVKLMVRLADVQVGKDQIETVLDACCGSEAF